MLKIIDVRAEGVNFKIHYNVDKFGEWEQIGIYLENSDIDLFEVLKQSVNSTIEYEIEKDIQIGG